MFEKRQKLISSAERYEERARAEDRRSSKYSSGPTSGQVSKLYEKAGDAWKEVNKLKNADQNYQDALKNAYSKMTEARIDKKIQELKPTKKRGLEKHLSFAILAIVSLSGSLFFISSNFTGYIIGGQFQNNSGFFSLGLFFLGLVFSFFYFKGKK